MKILHERVYGNRVYVMGHGVLHEDGAHDSEQNPAQTGRLGQDEGRHLNIYKELPNGLRVVPSVASK